MPFVAGCTSALALPELVDIPPIIRDARRSAELPAPDLSDLAVFLVEMAHENSVSESINQANQKEDAPSITDFSLSAEFNRAIETIRESGAVGSPEMRLSVIAIITTRQAR